MNKISKFYIKTDQYYWFFPFFLDSNIVHISTGDQNLMKKFGILFFFLTINSKFELFSLYSVIFTDAIFQHLQK